MDPKITEIKEFLKLLGPKQYLTNNNRSQTNNDGTNTHTYISEAIALAYQST